MRAGVGLLIMAVLMTPGADGVAKALAAEHPPLTIAFARYLAAGLIALALARLSGRRIAVPPGDRLGQVVRTALLVGAMTALIAALRLVPMAEATGGFLIAPIVSGLLGILVWRERPTVPRLAGAAVSFAGAAALLRPEAGLEPGCLLALLGGTLLGAYLAATRAARSTDPLSTLAVQSLLGAAMLAPFALAAGPPAVTPGLLGGAVALGLLSAACHVLTVAAYRRADASVLAPFLYFNLLTATAVGFLWFGETPGWTSVAALLAIALGGLVALSEPGRRVRPGAAARPRPA